MAFDLSHAVAQRGYAPILFIYRFPLYQEHWRHFVGIQTPAWFWVNFCHSPEILRSQLVIIGQQKNRKHREVQGKQTYSRNWRQSETIADLILFFYNLFQCHLVVICYYCHTVAAAHFWAVFLTSIKYRRNQECPVIQRRAEKNFFLWLKINESKILIYLN